MTIAETLLLDFDSEISNTRRTLERLPDTLDPEWAPHSKSMKVGKLAMHCATISLFGHYVFEDESMDLYSTQRPHASLEWQGREHALAQLDDAATKCRKSLEGATDEHMLENWRFSFGEHLISDMSRAKTYRQVYFNHLVHHTSQLGVYLRLLDIPVPALYGPSADEQWSAPK